MTNKKYQITGKDIICMTIDIETVCQKAASLYDCSGSEKSKEISELRRWCDAAQAGDILTTPHYTVTVFSIR